MMVKNASEALSLQGRERALICMALLICSGPGGHLAPALAAEEKAQTGGASAQTAAPQGKASSSAGTVSFSIKLAPPNARVSLDGKPLALSAGRNGFRVGRIARGSHSLGLSAAGCSPRTLSIVAGSAAIVLEEKLEREGSPLVLEGFGGTGLRPKSVAFTPDGKLLILPLLSGRGADVLDAATLKKIGCLEPPLSYAKSEGFVESAYLASKNEIWVSQMHNSMIHVFDRASLAYKTSFKSGGSYPKVIAFGRGPAVGSAPARAASKAGTAGTATGPAAPRELAFVSNWVSEDVAVFDAETHELLKKVKIGSIPRGLALSPDGSSLYIASFGKGSIFRLSLANYELSVFWKADGGAKRHLVVDSVRNRLYATDMDRGSVFCFDLKTGKLLAETPIGTNPNSCVLGKDGRYLYSCTRGPNGADGYEKKGPLAGELVVIDTATFKVVYRQWGGNQPTGIDISPDGRKLVFTDFLDRRVELYSLEAPL